VAANLADAPMPTLTVDTPATTQLRSLLPNFTLPSIVVPRISAPLMKLPANFSLPVFTIPIGNRTLQRVLNLVPDLTALPTLMMPRVPEVNISVITSHVNVTLPEVSAGRGNVFSSVLHACFGCGHTKCFCTTHMSWHQQTLHVFLLGEVTTAVFGGL
jgi:hypothetical protein